MSRLTFALSTSLCAALLVGCGDDTDSTSPDGGTLVDGSSDAPPLYAITTQITPMSGPTTGYIVLTEELAGGALDITGASQVPGRALGVGPAGGGALFVASDSAPTVTRYDLDDSGTLREGATLSFQNAGIAGIGEYGGQFQFISPTKAYFFHGATAQVVIWNPDAMEVTGSIDLSDLVLSGQTLTWTAAPLRQDNLLITFPGWRTGPTSVPAAAAVVVIDTTTDTATTDTDNRGGYVRDGAFGPDGKVYVATEAFGSAVHHINNANGPAPALLRFDVATKTFDDNFYVPLASLLDGATAGSLVRGADDSVFIRVLDPSLATDEDLTAPRRLASASAWTWAQLTLGDTPTATRISAPASAGSVVAVDLGDREVVTSFADGNTTLLEITADGPKVIGTATGTAFSAARLR